MNNTPLKLRKRQIHLDFHTSPYIPDVATEFDAEEFVRTFKEAHVDSVTIFGKCHHGMCYYPTTTGQQHPALIKQNNRDLLGEQIEALHKAGLRCPIYTTVVWEEKVAQLYPEWRQVNEDGTFSQVETSADQHTKQPGGWKFNNFIHPGYQDYIEAHIIELLDRYGSEVDGIFFDILFFHNNACYSDESRKYRAAKGIDIKSPGGHVLFEAAAQSDFAERFTRLIHDRLRTATVFYNSNTFADIQPPQHAVGLRARQPHQTHFELESLPSGFWGYQHFSRMARQVMAWDTAWLGMTGRFQRMWGDFGGIKPQPALEYECFRTQALGGANSVGDQLPPRGAPDRAAYELIGEVYAQCEAADDFYESSVPNPQVAILLPGYVTLNRESTDKSLEGAVLLCDEAHYDTVVIDDPSSAGNCQTIILPDSVVITPDVYTGLKAYYASGGALLISHRAGFDDTGKWALDFLPIIYVGEGEMWPSYWRSAPEYRSGISGSDRVFYERGLKFKTTDSSAKTLVERVLPYFQRTDAHFSSHFQTPPIAKTSGDAAVISGDRFVYFADPIFREYRQAGNPAARIVFREIMELLAALATFGAGLPSTINIIPRRRGDDLILTLLHYIPIRKALEIDIIDERMSFGGETLTMPTKVARVVVFQTGQSLARDNDGGFILPSVKGRLLLEVPGYFQQLA
jgi:hypothetical protein